MRGRGLRTTIALGSLLWSIALAQTFRTSRPGTDFSKYHTYKWVTVKEGPHTDPSLDAKIKQSIDSQLAARGLTRTDDVVDLDIEYQLAISSVQVWQTYEDWTLAGPAARLPQRKGFLIGVGTLVLDVYDPTEKELIWTGRANTALDPDSSETDKTRALLRAVKGL